MDTPMNRHLPRAIAARPFDSASAAWRTHATSARFSPDRSASYRHESGLPARRSPRPMLGEPVRRRAQYAFQQSARCVELPFSDAERAWTYLTYGSLVTVTG
jgi:hypothetical protein